VIGSQDPLTVGQQLAVEPQRSDPISHLAGPERLVIPRGKHVRVVGSQDPPAIWQKLGEEPQRSGCIAYRSGPRRLVAPRSEGVGGGRARGPAGGRPAAR
jgi:hypothetical protein